MSEIRQTRDFADWLASVKDNVSRGRIAARIRRLKFGHWGDVKAVGKGVSEIRLDVGPGYRVYFAKVNDEIVILLCAGDKSSQSRDILRAQAMTAGDGHDSADNQF